MGGHHVGRQEELAAEAAAREALRTNNGVEPTVWLDGDGRMVDQGVAPEPVRVPDAPRAVNDGAYEQRAKTPAQVEPTVWLTRTEMKQRQLELRQERARQKTTEVPALQEVDLDEVATIIDRAPISEELATVKNLHPEGPDNVLTLVDVPTVPTIDTVVYSETQPIDEATRDLSEAESATVDLSESTRRLGDPDATQPGPASERIRGDVELKDGVRVDVAVEQVESIYRFRKALEDGGTLRNIGFRFEKVGEDVSGTAVYKDIPGKDVTILRPVGKGGNLSSTFFASSQGPDGPANLVVKIHEADLISKNLDNLVVATKEAVASYGKRGDLTEGIKRYVDKNGNEMIVTVMRKAEGELASDVGNEQQRELQTSKGVERMGRAMDSWLAQVEVAEAHGIAHRDIKPGNLFVTEDGIGSSLIDFGIAEQMLTPQMEIVTDGALGTVRGTPQYMLPDLLTGDDRQVMNGDIYSVALSVGRIMGFIRPKRNKNEGVMTIMTRIAKGQYFESPPLETAEDRRAFIDTYGGGAKLRLYELVRQIVRPEDRKLTDRHEAWRRAGLLYREDEELFEDKTAGHQVVEIRDAADDGAIEELPDSAIEPMTEFIGADARASYDKEEQIISISKTDLLNVTRIRNRLKEIFTLAEAEQSGTYPAVAVEAQERWIETGTWDQPAAA